MHDGMNASIPDIPNKCMLKPSLFASKTLSTGATRYSNIEREDLTTLCGLKNCHYSFGRLVKVITDHKPPVAILKGYCTEVLVYNLAFMQVSHCVGIIVAS